MDNSIKKSSNDRGKMVFYSDQFFLGSIDDPGFFSASIIQNSYDYKTLNLSLAGDIGEGIIRTRFNLEDEENKEQAIMFVKKIAEGFQNLYSALRKECRDD